jgi:PadR family transcriptional regulator PadR
VSDGKFETSSTDWLVPFLLLNLRERDHYGHELTQRMADFDCGTIRPGAMYQSLRQMEKEGLIISEYDGFDSRLSWRRYSITESGESYLERWASSLVECQEKVDLFFSRYEGSAQSIRGRGTEREER